MATAEEQYWIDRAKAEQAQRDKEAKTANGTAGVAGGVLSMLSSLGGAIPNLLQQPEKGYLKRAQAGQGAGASIARQTASEAARRVVGASTAQPGAGRGGALREGLRSAEDITAQGAAQAAETGAREGLAATQMLRQGDYARRGAGQMIGAGLGQGLAGISAMLAAAKDQGPVQPAAGQTGFEAQAQAMLPGQAEMSQVDPATGLSTTPAVQGPPTETQQNIADFQVAQQGLQQTAQGPYKDAIDQKSAAMQERGRLEAQPPQPAQAPQPKPKVTRQAIEQASSPEAKIESHMSAIEDAGAQRKAATLGYIATASTPEAEENRTWMEQMELNPYWETLAMQLADREITEEQAREMMRITGAPPQYIELAIQGALAGQRKFAMDLIGAAKKAKADQKYIDAGAYAGKGPNKPKPEKQSKQYRTDGYGQGLDLTEWRGK